MFNSDYCDEYGRYVLTDGTSDVVEQAYNIILSVSPFTVGVEEKEFIRILTFFNGDGSMCNDVYADNVRKYAINLAAKMCPSDCILDWSNAFPNRLAYYKKGE